MALILDAARSAIRHAATAWLGSYVAFAEKSELDVSRPGATSADLNLTEVETSLNPAANPADLRDTLVTRLIGGGHLRSRDVIAAFQDTERHRFLPGVDVQTAYVHDAVPIKHNETGEMISCISAPSIIATQLEQLGAAPGHVQRELHGHRGLKDDPLYRVRGTLHTGAGLLTDKQAQRLRELFAADEHVEVEATGASTSG